MFTPPPGIRTYLGADGLPRPGATSAPQLGRQDTAARRLNYSDLQPQMTNIYGGYDAGLVRGNVTDPIKLADRKVRTAARYALQEKFGRGSMTDVRNRYEKVRFDDTMKAAATHYETQLQNRINEGFQGRGRYRRMKRRYRGRGMYMAGAIPSRGAYLGHNRYAGRGSFWDTLKHARKKIVGASRKVYHNVDRFAEMGETAAGWAGQPAIGAGIHAGAAGIKGIAGILGGRGAYNTLFPELGPAPVEFDSAQSEHGNLIVSGSEKVMDVFGNSAGVDFSTVAVPLFPGNFEHFPKLAQHAANFKEYEYVQLIFVYKTNIATNWQTDSVTTGKVIMATQMDVSRDPWTTYDELSSIENKTEGLVTGINEEDRMHTHGVECEPGSLTSKGLKFVRTKGLTGKQDLNDYDLGRFQFGLFGTGASLQDEMIGELWVQYKVIFKNHRMYSMLGANIPQSIWKQTVSYPYGSTDDSNQSQLAKLTESAFDTSAMTACDYNNIQPLVTCAKHILTVEAGSDTYQVATSRVKITFSSNLRGDYELDLTASGLLIPDMGSVAYGLSASLFTAWGDIATYYPLPGVTGTTKLNYDIPVVSGAATDVQGVFSYPQSPQLLIMGMLTSAMKVHVHLGQATSTAENSITIDFPFYIGAKNANLVDGYDADVNSGSLDASSLSIKQYNAYQTFGSTGLPYS